VGRPRPRSPGDGRGGGAARLAVVEHFDSSWTPLPAATATGRATSSGRSAPPGHAFEWARLL
jgi:mannose/cellobiose epimerase-like protein (N-acyl-D-glucosamine 2-epimerase family)